MQTVEEILSIIGRKATPRPPQLVKLDHALGCKLVRSIAMDIDSPPFDRALLDGYAMRSADAAAGSQLKIVGRQDAGSAAHFQVIQGQCVAINTGAPMPDGADTVAMIEITHPVTGSMAFMQLSKSVATGTGVQRRGSDAQAGQTVLHQGMILTPAALAVAAAAGADSLLVVPRPRVAILATGDELVPIASKPGPSQIRNTNSTLMKSLLAAVGMDYPLDLGVARDDPAVTQQALARGFNEADVLIVSGGMSMGTRDLVPHLLLELGVQIHVQKVRMKPGKPFIFATFSGRPTGDVVPPTKYILGLPGNPVSAFVCFKRFVEPLLSVLRGLPQSSPLRQAVCPDPLPPNGDREFYQPCTLTTDTPTPLVRPLTWKGSADLYTLVQAQALIVHPANAPSRPHGAVVDILTL